MSLALKPYCSVEEQIALLESRGMVLDQADATKWLSSVGYYRLSGYWYLYRESSQGQRLEQFADGTHFADVVALYEFDRKLRTLVHDGIERVEVLIRSQLCEVIGATAPLAYLDPSIFRTRFDHSTWVQTIERRVDRARRHNEMVKHHDERYGGMLPIWVLSELLDFADTSILYSALPAATQLEIAENVGVSIDLTVLSKNQAEKARKTPPLARWLQQLTVVRNTSAHHSRLWNRSFTPASTTAMKTIPQLQSLSGGENKRIYGALCVIALLLETASPGSTWRYKVRDLVTDSFTNIQGRHVSEMGFPESWFDDPFWSGGRNV